MVRALFALWGFITSAWLLEAVGAVLIVAAVHEAWGVPAALGAAGAALLGKAYEIDTRSSA